MPTHCTIYLEFREARICINIHRKSSTENFLETTFDPEHYSVQFLLPCDFWTWLYHINGHEGVDRHKVLSHKWLDGVIATSVLLTIRQLHTNTNKRKIINTVTCVTLLAEKRDFQRSQSRVSTVVITAIIRINWIMMIGYKLALGSQLSVRLMPHTKVYGNLIMVNSFGGVYCWGVWKPIFPMKTRKGAGQSPSLTLMKSVWMKIESNMSMCGANKRIVLQTNFLL